MHLTVLAPSRRPQSNCATSAGVTALYAPRAQSRVYGCPVHRGRRFLASSARPGALPAVQNPDAVGFPDVCYSLASCASQASLLADRRLHRVSLLKTFSMWNRLRPRRCARATRWLSACFSLPQLLMAWCQGEPAGFLRTGGGEPGLRPALGLTGPQGTAPASPDGFPATKPMDLPHVTCQLQTSSVGHFARYSNPRVADITCGLGQISSMSFCSHHRSHRTMRSACR